MNVLQSHCFRSRALRLSAVAVICSVGSVFAQGPVAWWTFDEAAGTTAVDASGNGHDGTLIGDAVFEPAGGKFGGAVSLDGDGDLVDVPDADELGFPQGEDFTISLFYNGSASETNNGLITKGYGDNPRQPTGYYLLQVTNNQQFELDSRCCAGGTPRFRTGQVGPSLTDGAWHNVTVVRDYTAHEIRSYIDGNLEHTQVMNAANGGDWDMGVNDESLQIGDHLNRFTTGKFDDVALWNRALSAEEITAIVTNGVGAALDSVAIVFRGGTSVLLGAPVTLQWVVAPGATVTIDQGVGDVTAMTDAQGNGSIEVTPGGATTYTLTADDGVTSEQLQATVNTKLLGTFETSAGSVEQGGAVTLSWTVAASASVTIDQGVGNVDAQTVDGAGSIEINPGASAMYTLTASQGGNDEMATVTINVIDATEGPVAYWPFDEGSGTTAADLSGSLHEHPAELMGGATFEPAGGLFGGAVCLDGASGEVRAADHEDYEFPQGQDFAITLFYNSGGIAADNNNGLISKGYGDTPRSPDGYYLLQVTNPSQFELDSRCCAGGTPRFRTGKIGPSITDGIWHNVTVVRDYGANEIRTYIDGNLEHTQIMNTSNGGDWNMGVNDEDVVIGDHLERFTAGKIDEVAIWRRILSDGEIADIVANGVGSSIGKTKIRLGVESGPGAMLTLRWDSQGGKLYTVRSETDLSAREPITWPIFDGNQDLVATPPENTLTFARPADTERFFIIEEFNAPPVSIFSDDFESGQNAWTSGSDGTAGTDWQLGAPGGTGPAAANSPTNCFGTNLTTDYAFDANIWLRSPAIDLTGAGGATLNYARWYDIEIMFDQGSVSVLDAADDSVLAVLESTVEGASRDWEWETVSKSLPAEALGRNIKIEFRFLSDDIGNFAGWYIDDVEVTVP